MQRLLEPFQTVAVAGSDPIHAIVAPVSGFFQGRLAVSWNVTSVVHVASVEQKNCVLPKIVVEDVRSSSRIDANSDAVAVV